MSELEHLRDRVAELEHAMGLTAEFPDAVIPREFFTLNIHGIPKMREFLSIVFARPFASREAMYIAMYGSRPEADQPSMKILDVFACRVRQTLKSHGLEMQTTWGTRDSTGGYSMTDENKAKLRAIISEIKLRKAMS